MVMRTVGDTVYYARSLNGGQDWSAPQPLGLGKYPSVGLVQLPWMMWPPLMAVSVAYVSQDGTKLLYQWNDGYSDPGAGAWTSGEITPLGGVNPGPPSLVTGGDEYVGQGVFVAYNAGPVGSRQLFCNNFWWTDPAISVLETIDNGSQGTTGQPCLAVDGNLAMHASWRRGTNAIWYAPRGSFPYWSSKDPLATNNPAQQPFVEVYGEYVYVPWSDGQPSPSEVWRAKRLLSGGPWVYDRVSQGSVASESPTQAFDQFTTWSDGSPGPQPDVWYWAQNPQWPSDRVEYNEGTWSYWPHSQMAYWDGPGGTGADLWAAWTESPNPGQPPYTTRTKHLTFAPPLPPPGGDSFGSYYGVQSGQDTASPYCRRRDGVMKFRDKAVDFARDSLVYELPYLNPIYDYFVKVSSYRETGTNWAQALSVNGKTARTVRFVPNKVDTAWFKVPPEAYARDRKVAFSLKNLRGDYVTTLGITLYQRDPKRGGKGGPQAGEPIVAPVREVFAVYPNPTKSQAQIEYSLKAHGKVDLSVYDVTGRLVRRVVDGIRPAGVHRAVWDGKDETGRSLSSGIYLFRLSSPEKTRTARIVVVK